MEETLQKLNEQIAYARVNSSFYKYLPAEPLSSIEELKNLPLMTASDLVEHGKKILCCPVSQIRRMVTMQTSGTTGAPKRLAFTERDLEDTVEFFREGMHLLCDTGDTVMIFMPGKNPDGLCDLLSRGIRGFGGNPVVYGVISDYEEAAEVCREKGADVMIGTPAQIRRLALTAPDLKPKRVLLSADYSAPSLLSTIERIWNCQALNHYGSTESGLGCAVETPKRDGMLIRKDIFLEILEDGEIALTTLHREAMPLIRYRTGDLGKMLSNGKLGEVYGRKAELGRKVSITKLDELLFNIDAVLDYRVQMQADVLQVTVAGGSEAVKMASEAIQNVNLGVACHVCRDARTQSDGIAKRRIKQERR